MIQDLPDVSWKEYVDTRFESYDKAVQAALLAAEKAVNKAENSSNERFNSVNEFRGQLSDQVATFLPRQEYDVQHRSLDDKINVVINRLNEIEGRSRGLNDSWGYVVGAVGIIGIIITLIIKLK